MKANIHLTQQIAITCDYVFERIGATYLLSNIGTQSISEIKGYLLAHCRLRDDLAVQCVHISLRQRRGEDLEDQGWRCVSADLVQQLSLTDYPFVVVRHPGEHVHVVAAVSGFHCQRWRDSFSRLRAIGSTKEIECRHDLTETPGIGNVPQKSRPLSALDDDRKGKGSAEKQFISSVISRALETSTTLSGFRTELSSQKVRMNYVRHKGQIFCVYGRAEQWFPAYKLSRSFTLRPLILQISRNRKELHEKQILSTVIAQPISTAPARTESCRQSTIVGTTPTAVDTPCSSSSREQNPTSAEGGKVGQTEKAVSKLQPPPDTQSLVLPDARSGNIERGHTESEPRVERPHKVQQREQSSPAQQHIDSRSQDAASGRSFEEAVEIALSILRDPSYEQKWRLKRLADRRKQEKLERLRDLRAQRIVELMTGGAGYVR